MVRGVKTPQGRAETVGAYTPNSPRSTHTDMDNDGKNDVLVLFSRGAPGLVWYVRALAMALGLVGREVCVLIECSKSSCSGAFLRYRNTGSATSLTWTRYSTGLDDLEGDREATSGNWLGDGFKELARFNVEGDSAVYKKPAGAFDQTWDLVVNLGSAYHGISIDLDGSGYDALL